MIEVQGEVIAVEGGRALVRTAANSGGCGRCHEPGGCGSAKIGSMFRSEQAEFWLNNAIGAVVGEKVAICLAEEVSAQAALVGYLVPVVGIVLGAAGGVFTGGADAGDGHALAGEVVGLAAGMLLSRLIGRGRDENANPVLKRLEGGAC